MKVIQWGSAEMSKIGKKTIGKSCAAFKLYLLLFQMKPGMLLIVTLVVVGLQGIPLHEFLESNGFGHLLQIFEAQEVGITHIVGLSNEELRELGVVTIGGRHNIRAAAALAVVGGEVETEGGGDDAGEEEAGQAAGEAAEVEEEYELLFVEKKSSTGKTFHSFLHGFHKFKRKAVKEKGRAYFSCTAPGCTALMKAEYLSKATMNEEEPVPDLMSVPPPQAHTLRDGSIHPPMVSCHF